MIDRVEIQVEAGDGGKGAVSFRHEKYVPFGGPDGGDGGRGGNIVIRADGGLTTLRKFHRGMKRFVAAGGGNGMGKKMHGKNGRDLELEVPLGTLVFKRTDSDKELIADLTADGEGVIVAKGGRGGHGNARFATSTNQAPRIAERGDPGEEGSLLLELKLLADVGIIGHPSVGKSTLLAAASAARPKIADYPFTTTEPVLGVVDVDQRSFVLAEIPGLIEGAYKGRGLGHDFLRHAERTRVLIHLLDGTAQSPLTDMGQVNEELRRFSRLLSEKPQVVAVNKIDLPEVRGRLAELEKGLSEGGAPLHFISAASGEGVSELMAKACAMLDKVTPTMQSEKMAVFHPQPKRERVTVVKEGNTFIVSSQRAQKMVVRMDLNNPEARAYLRAQFARRGITAALERAGVKPGNIVMFGKIAFLWD